MSGALPFRVYSHSHAAYDANISHVHDVDGYTVPADEEVSTTSLFYPHTQQFNSCWQDVAPLPLAPEIPVVHNNVSAPLNWPDPDDQRYLLATSEHHEHFPNQGYNSWNFNIDNSMNWNHVAAHPYNLDLPVSSQEHRDHESHQHTGNGNSEAFTLPNRRINEAMKGDYSQSSLNYQNAHALPFHSLALSPLQPWDHDVFPSISPSASTPANSGDHVDSTYAAQLAGQHPFISIGFSDVPAIHNSSSYPVLRASTRPEEDDVHPTHSDHPAHDHKAAEGRSSDKKDMFRIEMPHQVTEDTQPNKRQAGFDDCVTVFETVPGAIVNAKRRRKLNPESHKSFKVTRRIGACLECRFRKRPCDPGTPCPYCIKTFGPHSIAQLNCHRESPFVGYDSTKYILITSRSRVLDFNPKIQNSDAVFQLGHIIIDGNSGPCSLPLNIPTFQCPISSLNLEDQSEILRTKSKSTEIGQENALLPNYITMVAEDEEVLGRRLETWAIEYSIKFSRLYSGRYPTAYAFNVGFLYVKKQLPEHELVWNILRAAAVSYILRAGVKCGTSSAFRTVQARIDTILYHRLQSAERSLFASLQKLVWVSAGRLKRQQLWPVAYVLWQTMRLICLRASHLACLVARPKGPQSESFTKDADHLRHCFNLLLSTHTALFRSHSPMLSDYNDKRNQDLLNDDEELIIEAVKMGNIIRNFQLHSLSRPFRSSNWYNPNMYSRFREVLKGKGVTT